jgi:hypothetical protein
MSTRYRCNETTPNLIEKSAILLSRIIQFIAIPADKSRNRYQMMGAPRRHLGKIVGNRSKASVSSVHHPEVRGAKATGLEGRRRKGRATPLHRGTIALNASEAP